MERNREGVGPGGREVGGVKNKLSIFEDIDPIFKLRKIALRDLDHFSAYVFVLIVRFPMFWFFKQSER